MACTEAYKEHIMYTFNGFCKIVIRYAAINAWCDRDRRQKEISFEYLTEEKFYPLSTSDKYFKSLTNNTPLQSVVRQLSSPIESLPPPCLSSALTNSHTPKLNNRRYIERHAKTGNQEKVSCFFAPIFGIFKNHRYYAVQRGNRKKFHLPFGKSASCPWSDYSNSYQYCYIPVFETLLHVLFVLSSCKKHIDSNCRYLDKLL